MICLSLAACGFQPMYGETQDRDIEAGTYLASVAVQPISGTLGQRLQIALEDRLDPTSSASLYGKAFALEVNVRSKREPVVVEPDGSIPRYNINLVSKVRLLDSKTGDVLHKGTVQRTASFNVADEKYAAFVAERDAVQRALVEISEDYVVSLAAYFAQNYKLSKSHNSDLGTSEALE